MKKLLCAVAISTVITSSMHLISLANNTKDIYFDNRTLTVENFITDSFCDSITIYYKQGLLEKKNYRFDTKEAFSHNDVGYTAFISYLKENGWADTTTPTPHESEGFNRLTKKQTFTKDDFEITVTVQYSYENESDILYTDVTFANTKVSSIPGQSTSETITCPRPIGNGVTYTLENDILTIKGNGGMFNFESPDELPWSNQKVTKLVIEEGVVSIGRNAFCALDELTAVEIKNPYITVDSFAFENCPALREIIFSGTQEQFDEISYNLVDSDNIEVYLSDGSKWLNSNEKELEEDRLINLASQIKMTIGSDELTAFGKTLKMDVAPQIINGRTMLPAKYVAENLGGEIEWIEKHRIVAVSKDSRTMIFRIDASEACLVSLEEDDDEYIEHLAFPDEFPMLESDEVSDLESDYFEDTAKSFGDSYTFGVELYSLDSAPVIIEDRTFMPVRFIATFLDADVMWDESTQTVTLEPVTFE